MAQGEYLLFLNSGDHFYKNEVLIENHKEFANYDLIAFDIHCLGLGHDFIHKHPDELQFSFLFEQTFAHQSVLIKKSLFDKIGLYDENLKIVSDWKLFIHAVVANSTYKSVHNVLSTFYFGGISSTGEGTFIRRREREVVLQTEFSLYYIDYKLLAEIEKSPMARKIASFILRSYIVLFSKQKLKNIIK
jgi:hypothetical protein